MYQLKGWERRKYVNDGEIPKLEKLFNNIDGAEIPLGMLSQYMPRQYRKVRDGLLPLKARELAKDCVAAVAEDYYAACHV